MVESMAERRDSPGPRPRGTTVLMTLGVGTPGVIKISSPSRESTIPQGSKLRAKARAGNKIFSMKVKTRMKVWF